MGKERIVWVDWMKALLIMCVVLGHAGSKFTGVIYIYHIPAFFFISGYLSNYDKQKTGRLSSFKYLIIAIICYNLFLMFVNAIELYLNGDPVYNLPILYKLYHLVVCPLIGTFWCYYVGSPFGHALCSQMWFVWTLIIIKFLYKFVAGKDIKVQIGISLICLLYVSFLNSYNIRTFFYIDRVMVALPFFAVGNMLRNKIKCNITSSIFKRGGVCVICLFIICCVFIANRHLNVGRFDMFHFIIGKSAVVYYLSSLIGTLCVLRISQMLPKIRFIKDISIGTFLILGLHLKILYYSTYLHVIDFDPTRLLALGIVLAICLPLIILCENKAPVLLGKAPKQKTVVK